MNIKFCSSPTSSRPASIKSYCAACMSITASPGVQAVQTLYRLNRSYSGPLGLKDTTFVLDFVNDGDEILAAFRTYYETAASPGSPIRTSSTTCAKLDVAGYYDEPEVDRVAETADRTFETAFDRVYHGSSISTMPRKRASRLWGVLATLSFVPLVPAQSRIEQFISFNDAVVALTHVRLIDGTGSPGRPDQTIVIDHGKIAAVGAAGETAVPPGARSLDLSGHSVYPGLIGMHEHLFYPSPGGAPLYNEQAISAPVLYLASGVTTARTAGSLEPYAALNTKKSIDRGMLPGPDLDITAPYIQGPGGYSVQMPVLRSPEDAHRFVEYWIAEGATSFKAYMNISHEALAAAIQSAHRHHLKITGHLCSVGFSEAAELGIDDLEHGLLVDSEFSPGKQPGICPNQMQSIESVEKLDLKSPQAQRLFRTLVSHKVAITSTLAVFEAFIPGKPPLQQRMLDAMSTEAANHYLESKEHAAEQSSATSALKQEMQFERAFVAAGGLLMAGCDPTGNGGALPGFGDQRNLELLVEAGFTAEQAIQIYSSNAARYLDRLVSIGTVAPGKQADLVVVLGNPTTHIADVERVKYVIKKGTIFDSEKLIQSVRGKIGPE